MHVLPNTHPLTREFNALMKQIDAGYEMHPMEIWEMAEQLREAGAIGWADKLVEYLPK